MLPLARCPLRATARCSKDIAKASYAVCWSLELIPLSKQQVCITGFKGDCWQEKEKLLLAPGGHCHSIKYSIYPIPLNFVQKHSHGLDSFQLICISVKRNVVGGLSKLSETKGSRNLSLIKTKMGTNAQTLGQKHLVLAKIIPSKSQFTSITRPSASLNLLN